MKKRGSHIEIILSFFIFISFLMFLLLILEPMIITQKDKQYILENTGEKIAGQVESAITQYTVEVPSVGKVAVSTTDIDSGTSPPEKEIYYSEDELNNNYNIDEEQNKIEIDGTEKKIKSKTEIKGIVKKDDDINPKIKELKEKYEDDNEYRELKKEMEIPAGVDFSFEFLDVNREVLIKAERNIPEEAEVYSKEISINYFTENEKEYGFLLIKIW